MNENTSALSNQVPFGDFEFEFERREGVCRGRNGNPGSPQIVAYELKERGRRRIPFEKLPPEMQKEFLKRAGVTTSEDLEW